MIQFKGKFRRTIFKSSDNYVIGLFKVREIDKEYEEYLNKTITFTGYFYDLNENDEYILDGKFVNHPRYGIQFNVTSYERIKPQDKDTLVAFLASGLFKGIGPKTALKIVETLGDDCVNLILEDYNNLLKVPGLTEKTATRIYNSLLNYEKNHMIMAYLFELGFNNKDALAIYNIYRDRTKEIIEDNAYQLIDDIEGINFMKVDQLRTKLGILANDIRRIKAAIIYIICEICNTIGHTYLFEEEIIDHVFKCLKTNIDTEIIREGIELLIKEHKIVIVGKRYYLRQLYDAELNVAHFLIKLNNKENDINNLDSQIKKVASHFDLTYNDRQQEAMRQSMKHNLLIITGGPGTGKTTVIKGIVTLYQQIMNLSYDQLVDQMVLLAPTGRAAKRISEATMLPASTIHRFLKWNKETNSFGINEYNKAEVKLVIVDEVSMIDVFLMDNLIKGLTNNVKLILVGDANQLPSMGAGQVLKDLIDSDVLNVVHLKQLYRQAESSTIIPLAHDINNGETNFDYLNNDSDCQLIESLAVNVIDNIKLICEQKLKEGLNYRQLQVLAPVYHGENGIDNLNKTLQTIINPQSLSKKELLVGDIIYREQDKILQLVNQIDDNVFNGDIGIIEKIIDDNNKEMYVNFDGNIVKYVASDFINIKHGYAISIHKSQGSEFDIVIMPIVNKYNRMLYRKLIYTGVTRAKHELFMVGEKDAFIRGILNNETNIRRTTLKEFLQKVTTNN
ncbi:MAG: ATP-dependent RecD-like DNA helicase [Bacilli bacterium]